MTYAKPEVTVLAPAQIAIQGMVKLLYIAYDNILENLSFATVAAYEADE
jgi:hypothetical protein